MHTFCNIFVYYIKMFNVRVHFVYFVWIQCRKATRFSTEWRLGGRFLAADHLNIAVAALAALVSHGTSDFLGVWRTEEEICHPFFLCQYMQSLEQVSHAKEVP